MFKKKVKNVYVGEAILRPNKHYVIVEDPRDFIFPSDYEKYTGAVVCPPGYHPVSYTPSCYMGADSLLFVNDTSVKVKVYEDSKTKKRFAPELGTPVR